MQYGRVIRAFGTVSALIAAPAAFASEMEKAVSVIQGRCMPCHSAEEAKGGLVLSNPEGMRTGGRSGVPALVAGKAEESLILARVLSEDPDERMPPEGSPLTDDDVAVLRDWINAGAEWQDLDAVARAHWAFHAPVQAAPPAVSDETWPRNAIDRFILARLDAEGLKPSPEADRPTLIRRAYLDLLGLPPAPEEVAAFAADERPDAYERLIDGLLDSPHYGERMAMTWLDAARYADTNGYEKDRHRSVWPYRDWVIDAFNNDMGYDRFVTEQLAGDLIPNATDAQKVATGFLRNSMINEEGGIDVEEFRYEAMIDRTNTAATVFLGLTMGCAQCHTHKYDPITHDEYFQFLAFLNNTDDAVVQIRDPETMRARAEIEGKIAAVTSDLENRFPADEVRTETTTLRPERAEGDGFALTVGDDGAVTATAERLPEKTVYRLHAPLPDAEIAVIHLDALPSADDAALPGFAEGGNFVLSELRFVVEDGAGERVLALARAEADREQDGYEAAKAIDGDGSTGWAVGGNGSLKDAGPRLTVHLAEPLRAPGAALRVELEQSHGNEHFLRRVALTGERTYVIVDDAPEEERRARHIERKLAAWMAERAPKARDWTVLEPLTAVSEKHATLSTLDDGSVLASGDWPNTDVYTVTFRSALPRITALRLEVLPHESLPGGGPGRGVIMSDDGDFLLSEVTLKAAPWDDPDSAADVAIASATESFAGGGNTAAKALDGQIDTGWSIKGGQGQAHRAVFALAEPVGHDGGTLLTLRMDQFYVHQHTLGRFRISVTGDDGAAEAIDVGAYEEAALLLAETERSADQRAALRKAFLHAAPELAAAHEEIAALRKSMPAYDTSLALVERADARVTRLHHRGEFLSPKHAVTPGTPAILPAFPEHVPRNRYTLAKWIAAPENPLTARVAVNRLWQQVFGVGLLDTPNDFGLRGAAPSHPELLDWLAVEYRRRGWSTKAMMRLFLTSAAYRQSSAMRPESIERDPANRLLARAPRFRTEGEVVRDIALAAGGQLDRTVGGPSVFPPLPPGMLAIVYPGQKWEADAEAAPRRSLYTYWKRSLPYPSLTTFDAPPRDTACVQRVRSNTPLQALTLLNDQTFFRAAQAMADRVMEECDGDDAARIAWAYRVTLARAPHDDETAVLRAFLDRRRAEYAGDGDAERHVWTLLCRVLLNLDEAITKS